MPLNVFLTWPASSLFSIILMFLGYRIFCGYKELCNAAKHLLDMTRVIFVLNYYVAERRWTHDLRCLCSQYYVVSRIPDISRVQRAVQCRWTPTLRWPASSLFSILLIFPGYQIFQCRWTPSWQWPASSLFSILLMFLGYRIFNGYKELLQCHWTPCWRDPRRLWS